MLQEMARKLQEKEKEKYERKQRERELARERKKLAELAAQKSAEVLQEYKLETARKLGSYTACACSLDLL